MTEHANSNLDRLAKLIQEGDTKNLQEIAELMGAVDDADPEIFGRPKPRVREPGVVRRLIGRWWR